MSEYELIFSTNIVGFIIKHLNDGRGRTEETVILKKKGNTYKIKYTLLFRYDYSNGLLCEPLSDIDIISNDEDIIIDDKERNILESLVRYQHSKWRSTCESSSFYLNGDC